MFGFFIEENRFLGQFKLIIKMSAKYGLKNKFYVLKFNSKNYGIKVVFFTKKYKTYRKQYSKLKIQV